MHSVLLWLGLGAGLFGQASPEPIKLLGRTTAPASVSAPLVSAATPSTPVKAAGKASAAEEVVAAVSALSRYVTEQSHPEALRTAIRAYYNFKTANPDRVRNPYLYFVDYGLSNRAARGYVFDMRDLKLVEGPFTVAHGRGSGADGAPTRFSNRSGSAATSLGLYVTQETYSFSGKSGGRSYGSVGLRLAGVSGEFNSKARARGVVAHGAPYVTSTRAGRSEGCPAMEQARARRLLPKIANGGMVFLFSPRDTNWMHSDPWINAASS